MSSNNAIIAIIVILVLAVGGYFLFMHTAAAPTTQTPSAAVQTEPTATTAPATTASQPAVPAQTSALVTYTDSGFSPKTISVKVGTTVRFVNNSSHGMWVASGNHPTHTLYDGTDLAQHCAGGVNTKDDFDACKAIAPQGVYSFTFTKAGSFIYHNHVSASDTGTVVVTP